jgi:hypothetical protein
MPARDPNKPKGWYCDAQKPNRPPGDICSQRAGHGTSHPKIGRCSRHGGNTASHTAAAAAEVARRACNTLGLPIETGPGEALLQELCETVGNVAFYRSLVRQLPTHPDPDVYVQPEEGEEEGHWKRGQTGVYGRTYHVSGIPTGEAKPHILVVLYNAERKHLKEVSAAALNAGVQERAVAAMEDAATRMVAVLADYTERLGLDRESPAVLEAGSEALKLLARESMAA